MYFAVETDTCRMTGQPASSAVCAIMGTTSSAWMLNAGTPLPSFSACRSMGIIVVYMSCHSRARICRVFDTFSAAQPIINVV